MGACASSTGGGSGNLPRISVRQPGENSGRALRYPACKVVLLGNSAAGKTSLVQRFTRDRWEEEPVATIGAAFTSHVVDLMDGRALQLDIWDTAGQERYRTLAPLYYRNAGAAVVVFDVTSAQSFDGSRAWVDDFQDRRPGGIVVLVGNKMDLDDERVVAQEDAEAYAKGKRLLYIEASAKRNLCVAELFELLACAILDRAAT